jgi:hypothetical protein
MTNAAMIWTLLCVAADVVVREITHIPGDQLSRRGPQPITSVPEHAESFGLTGAIWLDMESDKTIMALLPLCDRRTSTESDREFIVFWTEARTLIDLLLQHHPIPRPVSSVAPH